MSGINARTEYELNAGGYPVKNATYWKRQYDRLKAQTKPLSDEEILAITKDSSIFEYREFDDDMVRFARAIEERHGIK